MSRKKATVASAPYGPMTRRAETSATPAASAIPIGVHVEPELRNGEVELRQEGVEPDQHRPGQRRQQPAGAGERDPGRFGGVLAPASSSDSR